MNKNDIDELIRSVIQRVAVGPDMGKDIQQDEAQQVMQAILDGQINKIQAAVFLIALRMKRESMEEYAGILDAMQQEHQPVTADVDEVLYLADPFDGYVRHLPMSPFMPAVLAACGLPSIMQGVQSVGPKHGITAHKVLALYGVDVLASVENQAQNLKEAGWSYCDQSMAYPSLYALNDFRDVIVKRTAVTTLERVLKPITAKQKTHLLLGYVHKAYPDIYAAMAKQSGFDSALLVKGVEGGVTPALNKPLRSYYLSDGDLSDKQVTPLDVMQDYNDADDSGVLVKALPDQSGLVEQTLESGLNVLNGKPGVARDSLVLATATALFGLKKSPSISEALEVVKYSLDNGSAMACFEKMKIRN